MNFTKLYETWRVSFSSSIQCATLHQLTDFVRINFTSLPLRTCLRFSLIVCRTSNTRTSRPKLPPPVAFAELIQQSRSGRSTPGLSGGGSGTLHKSYSFEDITEEEDTGKLVVRDPSKQ